MVRSSSSGSDSDSDSSSLARRSKRSKSSKERRDERHKSHKKKSNKKEEAKREKKSKKEHKEHKEKKHSSSSRSRKKEKKRKRSRSRSSSSSTDGSSSDSSASSRSRSRSKKHKSSSHSSSSSVVIPLPSSSSITRCVGLIDTLLSHGGGDRARSIEEVQFLLFKLDAGSSVNVEDIQDPLVKHILATLFREMGLKLRQDPATHEQGWMTPVGGTGKVAYKLLTLLADAFLTQAQKDERAAAKATPTPVGPIGPSLPPSVPTVASSAESGPQLSPSQSAPSAPRVLGPAMPVAADFDALVSMSTMPTEDEANREEEDEAHNFGPKMPSQMTTQELAAFDRLRASREQLQALKQSSSGPNSVTGREEWMTALPSSVGGLPSASALAEILASGDVDAMRGRGFQTKRAAQRQEQDQDWAMGPAERERKQQERLAIKQAEQAVYQSTRGVSAATGVDLDLGSSVRASANSSAAAAQAANDRMMARYKQQQATTADSLMAAHQRAAEAANKSAAKSKEGLFVWDHDTEMGMRAVKGAAALKKEITSAFTLNDNFAPAGGV